MLVTGENDANIVASNGMRLEHSQHTSRYTRRKHTWTKLWKEYQEISLGHLWGSVMTPFTSWPILAHLAPPWPFEQVYSSHMHMFHMFHICSHLKFVASILIVFSHTDMRINEISPRISPSEAQWKCNRCDTACHFPPGSMVQALHFNMLTDPDISWDYAYLFDIFHLVRDND